MIMKNLNGETIQNVGGWQPVGLYNNIVLKFVQLFHLFWNFYLFLLADCLCYSG